MIKTLLGNNGTFVNTGNVQVQPQAPSTLASVLRSQTTSLKSPQTSGVIPAAQSQLPVKVMLNSMNTIKVMPNNSLSGIAGMLSNGEKFIYPTVSRISRILPTYSLSLDAGSLLDPARLAGISKTVVKFQPFEQLTGIAQERPEVVMLTNFEPLFNSPVGQNSSLFINPFIFSGQYNNMTDAGIFIDSQINVINLQTFNSDNLITSLENAYPALSQELQTRSDAISQALTQIKDDSSFLLNVVRIIESQKNQLDLHHDMYNVASSDVARAVVNFAAQVPPLGVNSKISSVADRIERSLLPKYDCVDTLVALGYSSDSVTTTFSSTKIWMQLLLELKGMLQHSSLQFIDVDPQYQRNDNNASTILKPAVTYFDVSPTLPALPIINTLIGDIEETTTKDVASMVNIISNAYNSLYQSVTFKNDETKIAAIAHLLSKEYKYSAGLSNADVINSLQNFYSYTVSPVNNKTVFDSCVGNFGNNITDFPPSTDQSLVSIAQNQNTGLANVGVLTFETKYVSGAPSVGTLTPGGDFYFDAIMDTDGTKFNTAPIDMLATQLQVQYNNFMIIVNGMNLASQPAYVSTANNWNPIVISDSEYLNNDSDLILSAAVRFMNSSGNVQSSFNDDLMLSVYSYAQTNNEVKTLLFMYMMSHIMAWGFKPSDASLTLNTSSATQTYLINRLIDVLVSIVSEVPHNVANVALTVNASPFTQPTRTSVSLTQGYIRSMMQATFESNATMMVGQFMSNVMSQFYTLPSMQTYSQTTYGNHLDTTIAMITFDFITMMLAKYGDQTITGKVVGVGAGTTQQIIPSFIVTRTSDNTSDSFNALMQKAIGESNLLQQVLTTITNVPNVLAGSLIGVSNYLNDKSSIATLSSIASTLDNNTNLIKMLLTEQQIMTLTSTVESLALAYASNSSSGVSSQQVPSLTDTSSTGAQDRLTILDESNVPTVLRDALYGFFQTSDLASPEASNKHILTIGIPAGFTQRLKQQVNVQTASYQDKRSDIVQVVIYKVDIINSDIVYQPLRFLFEMSRYPVRFGTSSWLSLPQQPSINDIINAIPTQNFMTNLTSATPTSALSGVEYASSAIAGNQGINNAAQAFDDLSYAFLTAQQRSSILYDHIVSQLLEYYIKLLTGINVSEYSYNMIDPPLPFDNGFLKTLTTYGLKYVLDSTTTNQATQPTSSGALFPSSIPRVLPSKFGSNENVALTSPRFSNVAGVAGVISNNVGLAGVQQATNQVRSLNQLQPASIDATLSLFDSHAVTSALPIIRTIAQMGQTMSSIASGDSLSKACLTPKQFDRVFNVIVDGRDFLIDLQQTLSTPFGRQAFDLMLWNGDIVQSDSDVQLSSTDITMLQLSPANKNLIGRPFPQGGLPGNINKYQYRDRDKTQGDFVTDKYFVTIETYDEV